MAKASSAILSEKCSTQIAGVCNCVLCDHFGGRSPFIFASQMQTNLKFFRFSRMNHMYPRKWSVRDRSISIGRGGGDGPEHLEKWWSKNS